MTVPLKLPIGISDFRDLHRGQYTFIDKSHLIKDIIDDGAKVILFTRPRRFGKTLNMSMLYHYFALSDEDTTALFKDLAIWQQGDDYRQHQGKYPVVFLTLKGFKFDNYGAALSKLAALISKLYAQHKTILATDCLDGREKQHFNAILNEKASETHVQSALLDLTEYLHRCYKVKPILIIDEYDSPIHTSFSNGYYKKMIGFMQHFLGDALKDNSHLHKGIITGILRVAKESIFSGLNNLEVYSILHRDYAQYFGFTQPEVNNLLEQSELTHLKDKIQVWYNGYQFRGVQIYNPWSILKCIKSQGEFDTYWVNTSDNKLIAKLLENASSYFQQQFEKLIQGKPIREPIEETIIFPDLEKRQELVWSLLLSSGYLKAIDFELIRGRKHCNLAIPNQEVADLFYQLVERWFPGNITPSYNPTIDALIRGDIDKFKKDLAKFLTQTFSYFDTGNKTPEQIYHAFVLGLVVGLMDHYVIQSNREAGDGRYDVVMMPKDKDRLGIIFEFKVLAKGAGQAALEKAAQAALAQIKTNNYLAEFEQAQIKSALQLGLSFSGKQFHSEAVELI